MRVLLIAEPGFAKREREMLRHLATGLADEGVRVFNAVDSATMSRRAAAVGSGLGLFATDVAYAPTGLPFTAAARGKRLARAASSLPIGQGLDVVHAMGTSTWDVALYAAKAERAALVLELWTAQMVDAAAYLLRLPAARGVWLSVADEALAERARAKVPAACRARVVACPWGAHVSETPHRQIDTSAEASVLLVAGESWVGDVRPALQALSAVAKSSRGLVLLSDGASAARLRLWPLAGELGLQQSLSIVPGELADWEPALDADAMLIPGATGEQSGLVLSVQGAGMPIVAFADPLASNLIHEVSAEIVDRSDAAAWEASLRRVLDGPDHAARLGERCRDYVHEQRLAFHWVSKTVALYERTKREATS